MVAAVTVLVSVGGSSALAGSAPLAWGTSVRVDSAEPSLTVTNLINGASCLSAGCVAVDQDGVATATNPYSSGGTWSLLNIGPYPLEGVSCVTTGATTGCVAVDSDGDVLTSTNPFAASPTWSSDGADPGQQFLDVSCAANGSVADCAALDSSGNIAVSTNAFGASPGWSLDNAVDSSDNAPRAIACTADGCAIGDTSGQLIGGDPFSTPAGGWHSTVSASGGPGVIYGISCFPTSPGDDCVAVDDEGNAVTSTAPYSASPAWSTHQAIATANEYLLGVWCTGGSSGGCVGVADDGSGGFVAATPTGSPLTAADWTMSPSSTYQDDTFDGSVACTSSGCVAGDYDGNILTTTASFPSVSGWAPHSPAVDNGSYLGPLSCVVTSGSSVGCVAVDQAGDVVTSTNPFISTPTWTTTNLDGTTPIDAVSCVQSGTTTQCAAVDHDGDIWSSTSPFSNTASLWTKGTTLDSGNPEDSAAADMTAISCVAASGGTDCEVGDADGNLAATKNVFTDPSAPSFSVLSYSDAFDISGISCLPIGSTPTCWATDNSSSNGYVLTDTPFATSPPAWAELTEDSGNALADIACVELTTSNAGCVASDDVGQVFSSGTAGTGSSWSAATIDTTGNGYPHLGAVSCAYPSSASGVTCDGVDQQGDDVASSSTFGGSPDWTSASEIVGSPLAGVSCVATSTTATGCIAVDDDGWAVTGTTPTGGAPGAPTDVTASAAGSGEASVSWTAPSSIGGSAISSYTVYAFLASDCGGGTCTSPVTSVSVSAPSTSTTVNGLTNGTSYELTVTATNQSGAGPASTPSNAVTPVTTPGAPTITSAMPGNGQVALVWSAPSTGGSPITAYTVQVYAAADCGASSCTGTPIATPSAGTSTSYTVTSLSNGTAYGLTVTATNAQGSSPASVPMSPVTPATVPSAPTIGTATAGNAQASVSWTAPSDGGNAITGYTIDTYVSSNCTSSCTGSPAATGDAAASASSGTVTGLTNGNSYKFTVTATNGVGTSQPSAPSNSVTPTAPATAPGAPTNVRAALPSDPPGSELEVTWTGSTTNGSSVTGYIVAAYLASQCSSTCSGSTVTSVTAGQSATSQLVTSLTNGTSYQFTVTAESGAGDSPASSPSNAETAGTTPGAPTGVNATASNTSASVFWTAPASDGGLTITTYTANAYLTNQCTSTCSGTPASTDAVPAASSFIPLSGLNNGTTYDVVAYATNSAGNGPFSSPLAQVTPATEPGAPTIGTATAGNAQASVAWAAPASDGGSSITGYTVDVWRAVQCTTSCVGTPTRTVSASSSPDVVSTLTNGANYEFTVIAINPMGTSAQSSPSNTVTPSTVPGAPTIGTATAGNAQATVAWTAPSANGSAITGYTIYAYLATQCTPTCSGTPVTSASAASSPGTVAGLTNGTSYELTVTARNADGPSTASNPSNAVTPSLSATTTTTSTTTTSTTTTSTTSTSTTSTSTTSTTTAQPGGGGGGSSGSGSGSGSGGSSSSSGSSPAASSTTTVAPPTTEPSTFTPVVSLIALGAVRKSALVVTLSCARQLCGGVVQLAHLVAQRVKRGHKKVAVVKLVAFASARYRLQAGKRGTVKLRLTNAESTALFRATGRRLDVTLRATVLGGRTLIRKVVLREAAKHRTTANKHRTTATKHPTTATKHPTTARRGSASQPRGTLGKGVS